MKELLQQALDAPECERIKDFYNVGPIQRAAVESFVEALAQQEQCGCREGECETKKDKTCRMTIEIAERDGIPEWTPAIGIECAISSLRDDAARLRDGSYAPLQIADDLDVIANDLGKCKSLTQQEHPASVDAYVGAREDAAIWKKRALEAEELNRKFIAEVNGPTYLGEPAQQEQPAQEPVSTDDMASAYLEKHLWKVIDMAGMWPKAKIDTRTWQHAMVYAPTQPALSESQITSIAYNCNALPEVITDKTLVDFVRAIEAHCRGGANK